MPTRITGRALALLSPRACQTSAMYVTMQPCQASHALSSQLHLYRPSVLLCRDQTRRWQLSMAGWHRLSRASSRCSASCHRRCKIRTSCSSCSTAGQCPSGSLTTTQKVIMPCLVSDYSWPEFRHEHRAGVAQLVEHALRKGEVQGSMPCICRHHLNDFLHKQHCSAPVHFTDLVFGA